jgi:hypothetical protein
MIINKNQSTTGYLDPQLLPLLLKRKSYRIMPYALQRINDLNYRIQLKNGGASKVAHHNKLKRYKGNDHPRWDKQAVKHLV